jgi:hypothetical protein
MTNSGDKPSEIAKRYIDDVINTSKRYGVGGPDSQAYDRALAETEVVFERLVRLSSASIKRLKDSALT